MAFKPELRDIADLLGVSRREAGEFCSEAAWHVTDREVTYARILAVLDAHPRDDPTPEAVARWIMATPPEDEPDEAGDYVELEYDDRRGRPNRIQRHDFRDAQAGFKTCPHGVPITQRYRICRPDG
jgi:hypothetical protein